MKPELRQLRAKTSHASSRRPSGIHFIERYVSTLIIPCIAAVLLLAAPAVESNVKSILPDFYSEPGLNPFRDPVTYNEMIDPFSGNLQLTFTDLVIPGNGGLDIKIQRTYNANNIYLSRKSPTNIAPNLTQPLPRTATGLGWTLHFGRVLKSGSQFGICDTNATNPQDDTLDNAVLELPDGRQEILFVNSTSFSTTFITKSQWVASCYGASQGLLVISPEGVKYTMDYRRTGGTTYSTDIDAAWYTTRIEDRNGNWIAIAYDTTAAAPAKEAILKQITSSDGRVVNFTYTDTTDSTKIRLTSINANGQTWNYGYTLITAAGFTGGYYQLTNVTRPDNLSWNYSYYNRSSGVAGNQVLQTVTHPYGGTVTYDYGYVCFMPVSCTSAYDTFNTLVVASKTNGGRDIAAGTWTYSYAPSTTEDVTAVTFPGGKYVYKHFGSKLVFGGSDIPGKRLWHLGLLKEKQTYNGTTLARDEVYTWDSSYKISNEIYRRPPYDGSNPNLPSYADAAVYSPVLVKKDVTLDGTTYSTTYGNFDANFNPQTVIESGQASRTTNLTYFPRNANQNIVRLVKDEIFAGEATGKNIYRTFDSKGNLTQITRRGVTENYTYFSTGDLNTKTNARNFRWTYSNYYRGIPQSVSEPEGITISRTVNATGTIASETNGRGYRTSYTYDGMNRLTSIMRPRGAAIGISWSATGRTVTRGSYSQTTTFDGFGRPSYVNTNGITQDINYNVLGYKSFESYLGSTAGTTYTTDAMGRVTAISHADGTNRSLQYLSGNVIRITNERGYATTYTYRSFGDPDNTAEKVLMRIDAPEGISTVFARNVLGQPTSVSQGGVTRTYGYDPANNFLNTVVHPETGTTTFGRDAVGNMTSRQVGSSGTTVYSYDGHNRLTFINYPGATPDVSQQYDGNHNLTVVDNGIARKVLGYDENDNLQSETLTVNGMTFTTGYTNDSLDYLSAITYPSSRRVSYTPDVLGRPTTVSPYLTSVTHYPHGVPQQLVYANGQVTNLTINNRQWISGIATQKTGIGYLVSLSYGYDGSANVTSITNALDSTDNKTLTYDGVDRLKTAGSVSVNYDAADNISSMQLGANGLTYAYSSNRLTGISGYRNYSFTYDVYGNIASNGQNSFSYDDASNLRTVAGNVIAGYDYDGTNLRVHKLKNGIDTYFVYLHDGRLLGEYNRTGVWLKEYAYLGDKLVAMAINVPDKPANVTTSSTINSGTYTISWSGVAGGVTNYELYESTSSDFSNASLIYSGTGTGLDISGKNPGTYYYRVRACNGFSCNDYAAAMNSVQVIRPDGDLNGDGKVDGADVLIAQRIVTSAIAANEFQLAHGDVAPLVNGTPNPNNMIDSADVLLIERKAMGLVSY
jgi:uncharacterized protein RhaS with RHS repeats